MKELLYSILYNEYFVLIIVTVVLIIVFKLLMKNKYRPVFEIKDTTFTILKDKINNIYIFTAINLKILMRVFIICIEGKFL